MTDPVAAELALLAQAGTPVAALWQTGPSLIVPRSYHRHAGYEAARARFAAEGWPVHERPSGGALVPQGPGVLNLSLAWTVPGAPGPWIEPIYLHLCRLLQVPLQALGIATHWQAVPGSFCDGRFNLACGAGAHARKIAGTAQYWRPRPAGATGPAGHTVLAHALLLVDPDLDLMHQRANAFERAVGSGQHYEPSRTVSVAQMLGPQAPPDWANQLRQRLAHTVSHTTLPARAG